MHPFAGCGLAGLAAAVAHPVWTVLSIFLLCLREASLVENATGIAMLRDQLLNQGNLFHQGNTRLAAQAGDCPGQVDAAADNLDFQAGHIDGPAIEFPPHIPPQFRVYTRHFLPFRC
jgi:hypothetical protein